MVTFGAGMNFVHLVVAVVVAAAFLCGHIVVCHMAAQAKEGK